MIEPQDIIAEPEKTDTLKIAVVSELFYNNTAKLIFDGEETASQKQYAYLDSYTPAVGDRVLLASIGGTYVILGKINYNVEPSGNEAKAGNFTTVKSSGLASLNSLEVSGSTRFKENVTFEISMTVPSLKVSGNVGFFGGTLASKKSISNVPSITTNQTADSTYSNNEQVMLGQLKADVINLRSSLNELITALKQYNLV